MRIHIWISKKVQTNNGNIFFEDVNTLANACKRIAELEYDKFGDFEPSASKPTYADARMLLSSNNWIGTADEAYQTLLDIWRAREPREVEKESEFLEERRFMREDALDTIKEFERKHDIRLKYNKAFKLWSWSLNDNKGDLLGHIIVNL